MKNQFLILIGGILLLFCNEVMAQTVITSPPTNQSICSGEPINLSVEATGNNLSYQWQQICPAEDFSVFLSDASGLPSNAVRSVYESNGTLYVATDNSGIAFLDSDDPSANGTIYTAGDGSGFPANSVRTVYESNGVVYAGTNNGGLALLDLSDPTNMWTVYTAGDGSGFPGATVTSVYESNGILYAATLNGGLALLDLSDPTATWTTYAAGDGSGFPNNRVYSVYESNGTLYTGTDNGLALLDLSDPTATWTTYVIGDGSGFPDWRVYSVYESNGILYAGTASGLALLDLNNPTGMWTVYTAGDGSGFPSNNVRSIYESNGIVYAATNNGLAVLDLSDPTATWTVYNNNNSSLIGCCFIYSVYESNGILYVAGTNGLATLVVGAMDIPNANSSTYTFDPENENCTYQVVITDDDFITVTTSPVSVTINEPTMGDYTETVCFGETALVNGESLAAGIHTQTLTNVAGCDSTLSITITEAESIAITDPIDQVVCSGESVTLSVTEAANLTYQWQQVCSEEITVFTDTPGSGFPNDFIIDVIEYNGLLYIAIQSGGLTVLDLATNTVQAVYTGGNIGFTSNNVRSVIETNGFIYAGTNTGLSVLNTNDPSPSWVTVSGGTNVLPQGFYHSLYEEGGIVYATTSSGIASFDTNDPNATWTIYPTNSLGLSSAREVLVLNGVIYGGFTGGFATLDTNDPNATWMIYQSGDGSGFPGNYVYGLTELSGQIYIATNGAVAVLDPNSNTIVTTYQAGDGSSFPSGTPVAIDEINGLIYASSNTGGIVVLDPSNPNPMWTSYQIGDGSVFSGNNAKVIYESNGVIYIGTSNGLAAINSGITDIDNATSSTYEFDVTDENCTYQVVVTNEQGCSITTAAASITINEPTTGTYTETVCFGGAAIIDGESYPAGTYNLLLTNAVGCDSLLTIEILELPLPVCDSTPVCDFEGTTTIEVYDESSCSCVTEVVPAPICDATPVCDFEGTTTIEVYDESSCSCVTDVVPAPVCDETEVCDGEGNITTQFYDAATCGCVTEVVAPPVCDTTGFCDGEGGILVQSYDPSTCGCVTEVVAPPVCDATEVCDGEGNITTQFYDAAICDCITVPVAPPACDTIGFCDGEGGILVQSYNPSTCSCVTEVVAPPVCDITEVCDGEGNITIEVYDAATCECVTEVVATICPDDIVVECDSYSGSIVTWNAPSFEGYECNLISENNCSDAPPINGFIYAGTYNGSHYYCSQNSYSWTQGQALCQSKGGNLATINDAAENAFIQNFLMTQNGWIGYNDVATEGVFEWANGEATTYSNWEVGQPNNLYGAEHYTRITKGSGQWTDRTNDYYFECVMEIPCSAGWIQTTGPASGSVFEGNTTTNIAYEYLAEDGTVYTCDFNVTVNECELDCVVCPEDVVYECPYDGIYLDLPTPSFDESCNIEDCTDGQYIPGFIYIGSFNGSQYYCSSSSNYRWNQARWKANNSGGHLVTIESAAENEFVQNAIMNSNAWIGLTDRFVEGEFEWNNGEAVTYTNWQNNQPNNWNNQDFVKISKWSGQWGDFHHYKRAEFVMEIPCGTSWEQVSGPANGSFLEVGSTETVEYEFAAEDGSVYTCSYEVSVTGENGTRIDNSLLDIDIDCDSGIICELRLAPNPTTGYSKLSYHTEVNLEVAISIMSATGKTLEIIRQPSQEGYNLVDLNFADYPQGLYFINLQMRGQTETIRVVKTQ